MLWDDISYMWADLRKGPRNFECIDFKATCLSITVHDLNETWVVYTGDITSVCEINGRHVANGNINHPLATKFALPGAILGDHLCSWRAWGWCAHNGTRDDIAWWVWSSLDLWRALALPRSPLLSTARIRQKMRVRVTIRQHLPPKEDALTATGRRDACGLSTTRITAWCSVSGVDALIGMSTETNLSKGAVQWSLRLSRNTKSWGSTKTQRQHNTPVLGHTALRWNSPYRPWNELRLSRWNAFSTLGFYLVEAERHFLIFLLCCSSKGWMVLQADSSDSENDLDP